MGGDSCGGFDGPQSRLLASLLREATTDDFAAGSSDDDEEGDADAAGWPSAVVVASGANGYRKAPSLFSHP